MRAGIAARGALALIGAYQRFISPLLGPSCRFVPSCSEYSRQAFAAHGFLKGLGLTVWRILRCQPFCEGGEDPVPPPKGSRGLPATPGRPPEGKRPDR